MSKTDLMELYLYVIALFAIVGISLDCQPDISIP